MINTNSNTGFVSKPKAIMCCICGREFGTHSIEIHMTQCEKKNNFRVKIPDQYYVLFDKVKQGVKLGPEDYEGFNNKANDEYREKSLFPCSKCGRRFMEDRLPIHENSCKGDKRYAETVLNKKPEGKVGFSSPQVMKSGKQPKSSIVEDDSTKLLEEKLNKQLGGMSMGGGGGKMGNPLSKSHNFSSPQKPKGPVFLTCYVCGREFGKHSIEIHLEQCMEKHYKDEINKGTPKKEINTPNPPEELLIILDKVKNKEEPSYSEILQYNQIGKQMYNDIMMKQCGKCGRKFNSDRLDVHLKSCNPQQLEQKQQKGGNMASKPRMHMCPLCGREFGSMSLEIHIKTCRIRFDREQETVPKHQRRSAADIIEKFKQVESKVSGSGNYCLDKVNEETFKVFNEEALIPCDLCGRTFLPDRLTVHLRSCKGPKKK